MPANDTYPLTGTVLEISLNTHQLRVQDSKMPGAPEWFIRPAPKAAVPALVPGDVIAAVVEDINELDSAGLPLLFEGTACSITRLCDAEEFEWLQQMEDLSFPEAFEDACCEPDDLADIPY